MTDRDRLEELKFKYSYKKPWQIRPGMIKAKEYAHDFDWLITALEEARLENERRQARIDRTITAALRYESRHDRDPERGKLWGELKMALMVDKAMRQSERGEGN